MSPDRSGLAHAPRRGVACLAELVGIARAIEDEAILRYRWLAEAMQRRDETATAEAFSAMAAEEAKHVDAVAAWAAGLGEAAAAPANWSWRLPVELAESWEEAATGALLTPYRAYAIAVDNEERAFAFYAYLASTAASEAIAREAERLAKEELRHAALLRIWRRAAWRQEHWAAAASAPQLHDVESPEALARLLAEREAEIARCHGRLARRLRALGDEESAQLLEELAAEAASLAASGGGPQPRADAASSGQRPIGILYDAMRPLEQLCEQLEELYLSAPSEPLQRLAESGLTRAVARIARLGRRIEELDGPQGFRRPSADDLP